MKSSERKAPSERDKRRAAKGDTPEKAAEDRRRHGQKQRDPGSAAKDASIRGAGVSAPQAW
jgi:hypothetical protein